MKSLSNLLTLSLLTLFLAFLLLAVPFNGYADPPAGRYRGRATTSKLSKVDITLKNKGDRLSGSGTVDLSGLIFQAKGTVFDGTNTFFGKATYIRPDGKKDRRALTGTYDPATRTFVFEIPVAGGKRQAIFNAKTNDDRCSEIIGFWAWFTGGVVNVNANNTMSTTNESQGTISGTWECTHVKGHFTLNWEGGTFIDTLKLSEDGKSIFGKNQNDTEVSGTKL